METYHNTNNEQGDVLERSNQKAETQELIILEHFLEGHQHTPDEVWQACFNNRTPITSVRRAITNLTTTGHLEKTDKQRPGMYGKKVYVWRYARTAGHQTTLF
jgi:hypothetical protein